jgi:hypothetical protein
VREESKEIAVPLIEVVSKIEFLQPFNHEEWLTVLSVH